jgi:hypothetical protein
MAGSKKNNAPLKATKETIVMQTRTIFPLQASIVGI